MSKPKRVTSLCKVNLPTHCRSGFPTVTQGLQGPLQYRTCRAFHQVGPAMLVANKRKRYSQLVPELVSRRITQAFHPVRRETAHLLKMSPPQVKMCGIGPAKIQIPRGKALCSTKKTKSQYRQRLGSGVNSVSLCSVTNHRSSNNQAPAHVYPCPTRDTRSRPEQRAYKPDKRIPQDDQAIHRPALQSLVEFRLVP